MSERHGVGSNPEAGTPLLRDRLAQTRDPRFRQAVVRLPRVTVRPARAAHVDDAPGFPVLDAEVRRSRPHQPEGRRVVHREDGVPLLVRHLVNDAVPRVPRVVDDVVDFPAAELGGFRDQHVEVFRVGDVPRDGDRAVRRGGVDFGGSFGGFGGVDVADDDLAAFVGEEAGCFRADALAGAGDDCGLVGEHSRGEVEVGGDLRGAGGHFEGIGW